MKISPRSKYMAINTKDFEVKLYATKPSLASMLNVHINTIGSLKERKIIGSWIIIKVNEE